ncbi:MAG: 3-hydroxyacyl-CoA dehydrogenase NAD-binding domain-containing protein [Sterolibacterium sp.]|nr:3-hydroxyacyl-CoA dehydrogenase NAD-binding domain-containing protein [Sterolibacterium sp.]
MQTLKFEVDTDGIALLTIDLPGRSMNVLTPELDDDLMEAVERVASDEKIKGAILTSAKPGSFLAGADIKFMLELFDNGVSAVEAAKLSEPLFKLLRRIETCGKPFAAAINGLALGGGMELALGCHYRVLADNPKAVIGFPEVGLGILPGGGGTQRLPRLIGIEKALPLLLTGRQVKPEEALKLGIVNALAKAEDVVAKAREWLLGKPTAVQPWDVKGFRVPGGAGPMAPHAPRSFTAGATILAQQTQRNNRAPLAIMSAVYEGTQVPIETGLRLEAKYFGTLLSGPVARNLMRTMFVNKGKADKLANRPADVPKLKVNKLGILGAGMMGAGIAYVAAEAGMQVVLLDAKQELAEKGKQYSVRLLEKSLSRGKTTQEKVAALLSRIKPTTDYADLAGCDYLVEAVFEDRGIKADVTRKAAAAIPATTVFGSNTSTLPITGLAEAFPRQEDFIGVHFFSPVERMPLIEIIMGQKTSQAALAKTLDFVQQLRKTPIVVKDSRGFFTSRVFGTFVKEGMAMLQQGVLPALIENGARQASMPVGPLTVSDEVSLEIMLHVYDQSVADGAPPKYEPELSINLIKKMTGQLGRKGRAGGAGFYEYPQGGKKFLWPGLAEHFPPSKEQPDVEEVKKRFLCIQALEAARCFEEGVITNPADADIGSILGIGYPSWTGGTLSYIETVGIQSFVAECDRLANLYGERYRPSAWLKERAQRNQAFHPRMSEA